MTSTPLRSPLLLTASMSALLLVDVQDKLLRLMGQEAELRWNLRRLAAGARVLNVPVLATEQYPEKLGPTTEELRGYVTGHANANGDANAPSIPGKLSFSCLGCAAFLSQLEPLEVRQVVVAGLESHVCVLQTALDLIAAGYEVFVPVDAIAARFSLDHHTALRRMESAGVTLLTVESVLFEWCERAGTAEFKEISQIVRLPRPADNSREGA